ncbi:50S ribosomal protein L15 [Sphingomonas azotifigens]|uniref:50S ribosomal protein L15 n=1 Tax=Sphingomonas azotifigens TaxID=330920 RepID=UPI000A043C6E|nr:50S ribosomal protein L15 [Sphingomonas azotifigens]
MKLNGLSDNAGARKRAKRRGRGIGSGLGKTAGRGQKGQKSRSGVAIKGFEGGQMPLHMRLPKRGFRPLTTKNVSEVNLETLNRLLEAGRIKPGDLVTERTLRECGVAKRGDVVKVLGKGEIAEALNLHVAMVSAKAREKIRAAGGAVETYLSDGPPRDAGGSEQLFATSPGITGDGPPEGDFRYDVLIGVLNGIASVGVKVFLDPKRKSFWRENAKRYFFQLGARDAAIQSVILTVDEILNFQDKPSDKVRMLKGRITGDHPEFHVDLIADGRPIHNSVTPIR